MRWAVEPDEMEGSLRRRLSGRILERERILLRAGIIRQCGGARQPLPLLPVIMRVTRTLMVLPTSSALVS